MSLDPTIGPTLDPAHAYELWASTYAPTAHTPLMRVEERTVRTLLPDLRGVTVLDVGCGTGRYLAVAQDLGARRVIGIDPSAAMLARVDVPEACVMRGDVERLPLGAGVADVTICALTLGHVPALGRAFGELARVTRAGGVLICSELHPIGAALGWRRTFTAQGRQYSVRDAGHSLDDWLSASAAAGWIVQARCEPTLQRDDVPPGVTIDARALTVPSALVMRLVRSEVDREVRA